MDFTADLMWDGATRDHDAESLELARTAALADATQIVGPLVFQAGNANDLEHRLALVEPHLNAIAERRGYPAEALAQDLTRRWSLLDGARASRAQQTAAVRQVTAAQEAAMDQAVSRLAAMAARENPLVPMGECLRLASEAVQKHADAFPLAYESWGGAGDGPFTDRAKNFKPPGTKNPAAAVNPGSNGGDSTFDEVHQRLNDLDNRLNNGAGSPASGPPGPPSPTTASLDAMAAGFMDRVKNWWKGPQEGAATDHEETHEPVLPPGPPPSLTFNSPAPASTPAPAASHERAPYITPNNSAASDHVDDAVERHHDEQGRREFNDIMNRLNGDRAEMSHKWDTPSRDRFDHPEQVSHYLQGENDRQADDMGRRLDELGRTPSSLPFSHAEPGGRGTGEPPVRSAVTDFSHPGTGGTGGQQVLPTDPAAHAFSHQASFQHSLFE
ncbi:hypothetical protein ACH4S8_37825 [Streptomyces sp. NPDC021080]|uniref:hypothetical protein n=1 Tax=Streptomyces sp. NPDC021080 TaxID=3365110 RepID=UPI00379FED84